MGAVNEIVQWRDRIEKVQLAAEAALEEIDCVLGTVRAHGNSARPPRLETESETVRRTRTCSSAMQ